MADRTVRVTLIAQATGYIAGMDQATRKTRELSSEADRLARKRQAFEGLGRSLLAIGVAAAIGVGLAIAKYAEFDQAMSQVNAVTQETVANQELLRDAALEAGGATVYTAREAAEAEAELAKAGLSTANILSGALTGALSLAASGQLEVARAGEVTAITLKQFGLDGSQAARVADVLSAGANKAVGSVEDLAQGLKFVGPVADSMNVSLEDTVATLALFADRGVIGEQAGTSLRGMLASLTSPSKEAKAEIDRLNISLYDAETKRFLGLENAAGQLNGALAGLTDAERDMSLGLIFGNQQVTAARILVDAGASTWRDYRAAVEDSGIAARIAQERMNNLSGDVEKLGGAIDTALIQTGSGANDTLRGLVQTATLLVDGIGELPQPVLAAALAVGVATAGVAAFSGVSLLAIPRLADLRVWMTNAGLSAGALAGRLALATAATSAAIVVIGVLAARAADVKANTDEFRNSLNQTTGALTKYTRELVAEKLAQAGAFEGARLAGISQRELTDALIEGGPALDAVKEKLGQLRSAHVGAGTAALDAVNQLSTALDQSQNDWEDQKAATEGATDATDENAVALQTLQGVANATGNEIDELADKIRGFGSAQFDVREANRRVEQSLDDLQESLARNGQNLDISTQAGRDNQAALDSLAQAYLEQAAATGIAQGSLSAAIPVLDAGRAAFVAAAEAAGYGKTEAEALADQLGLLPSNVQILIAADTSAAQEGLDRFIRLNNGRSVRINAQVVNGPGFAYGGPTPPGPKHQVAGIVHAGEFVSTQETLKRPGNREALEYMHAGGDMSNWRSAPAQYFASGSSAPPQFAITVAPKGGIDLLEYVDIRVEQVDRSNQIETRMGSGKRN